MRKRQIEVMPRGAEAHIWDVNHRTLPPLIGREVEYEQIKSFLMSRLAMEHKQVLFLCGPCGAGKSTTVSQLLPHQEDGVTTIGCKVSVQVPRNADLCSERCPVGTNNHTEETCRVVPRDLRPLHVNCTDLSASKLIDELVVKMRYRQRQSDHLDAKEALLRCTASGGSEVSFSEKLDHILSTLCFPFQPGTNSRANTSARRSIRLSPASPSAACSATSGLMKEWTRCPLHVLVLDEADSCKSVVVLRNLFHLVHRCPLWFGMICISNDRWLKFLPRDDALALEYVHTIAFGAYSADVLKEIGALAVRDHNRGRKHLGPCDEEFDQSTEDKSIMLAPAAASFAAKTAVLNFCGDARKVKELCRRAADSSMTANDSMGSGVGIRPTLRDVSNFPTRYSSNGKRARSPAPLEGSDVPLGVSRNQMTASTVSLKDVMSAASIAAKPMASSVVANLPEQATYVLCCIVALARRKALAAFVQRMTTTGNAAPGRLPTTSSGGKEAAAAAALRGTDGKVFRDCGELCEGEVYRLYARLMRELQFHACNREAVIFSLELLKSRGVISGSKTFVCTGEWTLEELEGALVSEGTRLLKLQAEVLPPERATLLTNKFADAFYKLKIS